MFEKKNMKVVLAIMAMLVISFLVSRKSVLVYAAVSPEDFNEAPQYDAATNTITLPELEGYDVELLGSDHKEIIALNTKVNKPLNETAVNLVYKLTARSNGEITEGRKNAVVTIPARDNPISGVSSNKKPDVIPSLREWVGGSGSIRLTDASRIVVKSSDEEVLKNMASIFQEDLRVLSGYDLRIVYSDEPQSGDIYLSIGGESELGKEGYYLEFGGSDGQSGYAGITAPDKSGVYYGTMSILQILKQSVDRNTLPKGIARDYPMYESRGFMLDVGRKYTPLEYIYDILKQMSYYKMNTLQLHLSDNDIWEPLQKGNELYSAFRLESDIPGLTAKDGHYTKDEFRKLQLDGMAQNVNIIPEIDSPGHALAFTKVWPDLSVKDKPKYLNVENPETIKRIKAVFDEYMEGDNPVFVGPNVNIGTDEYKTATTPAAREAFRSYANELLEHINSYPGKKAAFWGSLDEVRGDTKVTDNALMLGWYRGYADAAKYMYEGYDIVTMEDQETYIVPGGGYYANQYGRGQYLYENWQPNIIKNGGNDVIPLGFPRLKGGWFALWNDHVGNGISVWDMGFRMQYNIHSVAQKTWANTESKKPYSEFKELGDKLGIAPNSEFLYENRTFTDNQVIVNDGEDTDNQAIDGIQFEEVKNVVNEEGRDGKALRFSGKESYIKTDVKSIGYDWTTSMWVKPDRDNPKDAVLMEGRTGVLKLKQGETNKLGFSVENYDHYFDYVVPTERWTHITLTGDAFGTSLYVNGLFKERLIDRDLPNYNENSGAYKKPVYYETLNLPTAYLGSKTNAFKGSIDGLEVFDRVMNEKEIKALPGFMVQESINLARDKVVTASGSEDINRWQPSAVVDGILTGDSRWSSNHDDAAWLMIDLGKEETIGQIKIHWEKAYAKKYKVQVSLMGADDSWEDVFDQQNGEGGIQDISFPPKQARYVRFLGGERTLIEGHKYGYSFYEMEVFAPNSRNLLLQEYNVCAELLEKGRMYISESLENSFDGILIRAEQCLTDDNVDEQGVNQIIVSLREIKNEVSPIYEAKLDLKNTLLEANKMAAKVEGKISADVYEKLQREIELSGKLLADRSTTKEAAKQQGLSLERILNEAQQAFENYSQIVNEANSILEKMREYMGVYSDLLSDRLAGKLIQSLVKLEEAIASKPVHTISEEMQHSKEILTLADEEIQAKNLSLKKNAVASSIEGAKFSPDKAVDGDRTSKDSRWSSRANESSPRFEEWFKVDLGSLQMIDRVDILWEASFAKEYKIYVSETDKEADFKEVEHVMEGKGGRSIVRFTPTNARYVKFEGIERTTGQWLSTYSFYEFEVYKRTEKDTATLKKEMQDLIEAAKNLDVLDYTSETWSTLKAAVAEAEKVLDNANASYAQILVAHNRLISSTNNLKPDKTNLSAEIEKYRDNESKYTQSSWSHFAGKLEYAIQVEADSNAGGRQITQVRKMLIEAGEGLVLRGHTKQLESLVAEYGKLEAKDYTIESWKVFTVAMNNAKTVLLNAADKSQKDMDDAKSELEEAYKGLEKSKVVPNITLNNEGTGIYVTGDFHDNVYLVSEIMSEELKNEQVGKIKDKNFLKKYQIEVIHDLKLMQYGKPYMLNGKMAVKLKVPDNLLGKKLFIFYLAPDGSVERHDADIIEGYIVFYTTHNSLYAIGTDRVLVEQGEKPSEKPGQTQGLKTSSDEKAPMTGDTSSMLVHKILILITLAVILCIGGKNYRKKICN